MLSDDADRQYADVVRAAAGLVVGLDFDGTLAPIVDDPTTARIHERAHEVLAGLAAVVRSVAVITGRPARQVVTLGSLEALGDTVHADGREVLVLGQYGNQRWSSTDRRIISPPPPAGLASLMAELPRLLLRADATSAWVEEKGLAVAVHTRRMDDPGAAFERLLPVLSEAADRHGLQVEPGRSVVEIRGPGVDKGISVRTLAGELDAAAFVFVGDDLGDLEAFRAVHELGVPHFLVCSGSTEESALVDLADAVVPGPAGVMDFLADLTSDIRRAHC